MGKHSKTQWHPGFVSAIKMELKNDRDILEYTSEYTLNSKPLQVDLLVIKKTGNRQVRNKIGEIFRAHNLMEYKSPSDSLDIDTFYKLVGCGCLYKSYGEKVDAIRIGEISLSLVRHGRPAGLIKALEQEGYKVARMYPGIYYIEGALPFKTQLLVTSELPKEENRWLTMLAKNLSVEDVRNLVMYAKAGSRRSQYEAECIDSVMQVAARENYSTFDDIMKEDPKMCEALRELMKPEFDAVIQQNTLDVTRDVTAAVTRDVTAAATKTIAGNLMAENPLLKEEDALSRARKLLSVGSC